MIKYFFSRPDKFILLILIRHLVVTGILILVYIEDGEIITLCLALAYYDYSFRNCAIRFNKHKETLQKVVGNYNPAEARRFNNQEKWIGITYKLGRYNKVITTKSEKVHKQFEDPAKDPLKHNWFSMCVETK